MADQAGGGPDETRKWTLITGASSGIGAELARVFAGRGHALVLSARREDRLAALAAELSPQVPVEVVAADLEDPAAPKALIAAVEARGIALHTLVNNAGFGLRGRFATLPAEEQAGMVELNVAALTKLCRIVLPGLIARRAGGIMNLSSVAAYLPGPNMAVYYATKAYVLSLSEALYEEAKRDGVTVTAVCPGATATEFSKRADLEMVKSFRSGIMDAATVARMAVDGYLKGEAVVVTGGSNLVATVGLKFIPRAISRKIAARLQN